MDAEMEFEAYSNLTNVQRFMYGQTIFLTGVTGLIGKVLLEKILRSCPGVGKVYLLMRPKRGMTPKQRLDKLFKAELFNKMKETFPMYREKVQVVEGDITEERLGMSFEDYETVYQNTNIVLHSAATVQFNDPLKTAVQQNVKAVNNILDLCHEIPNIKAVVHVSTSFVKRTADGTVLEEIPTTKISPQKLLDTVEWMDDKTEQAVSDFLTEKTLTTYLVTKAMAEALIGERRGNLPIAIVRPAYIGPTYKDPFPGWIDSLQGVSGLLLAGAKGVLRTLQSVQGFKLNLIPVDMAVNTIITSAWHVGTTRPESLFIINTVIEYEKLPYADEEILDFTLQKRTEYPLVNMFRYPDFKVYYNSFSYITHAIFDQWIPALIIDFLLFIFTGRTILMKIYAKIYFLYDIFYRLGKDPWICKVDNYNFLMNKISEEDEEIFWMNTDGYDWPWYMDQCLQGGRRFLAREDPSNIPYAKKKAFIWWLVTTILKWCIIVYFLYYLLTRQFFLNLYDDMVEKVYSLRS